jgi:hypothetical protein
MNTPGYESLAAVLQRAYDQAAKGKGAERHAVSRPFTEQPMQSISGLLQSPIGLLYQAMKKIQESQRLDKDAGVRELLGAINYLAGAIIFVEAGQQEKPKTIDCTPNEFLVPKVNPLNTVPVQGLPLSENALQQAAKELRGKVNFVRHEPPASWVCTDQGNHKPEPVLTGNACPICFAPSAT